MPRIDNIQRIKVEDFDREQQEVVEKIAIIYNYFAENVSNVINGELDYDNTKNQIIDIEVTVDTNGIPSVSTKFTSRPGLQGTNVVRADNLTNASGYPTSAPFIVYTANGGGVYTINKVTGLVANQKYRLKTELIFI